MAEPLKYAQAIAKGKWCGDTDILPDGAEVDILAADPAGRMDREFYKEHGIIGGVPARTALWIRWWPERRNHASYRSCDLADVEVSDEDFDRLTGETEA